MTNGKSSTQIRHLNATIEQRTRELEVLGNVVARIHDEEDPRLILDIALEEIVNCMKLQTAWVFMGDEEDGHLHLAAHRGLAESFLARVEAQGLDPCLCPEVFRRGHRMQARNTTDCPRMPELVAGLEEPVPHACIPLKLEAGSLGVLNVAARPGEAFSDEELRFLETLGHQICLAIERGRHLRAERLRNQQAQAMAALSRASGGSLDAEEVLRAVGKTALELLEADRVQVFLGDDPSRVTVSHLAGLPHPDLKVGEVVDLEARGSRLLRQAVTEGCSFRIDNASTDGRLHRKLARSWGVGSALVVPLAGRGHVLGVIAVTRTEASTWSQDQADLAEALTAQASVALDNARLYEESRRSYAELHEAQRRIIQNEKMAVLGTFASGLAHEVRNPLNSIGLQLSILERRLSKTRAPVADGVLQVTNIIREEISRLDALVGDFLRFSTTNRLQYTHGDLDALLDEVVRLLRPEARSAAVTLRRQRHGAALPPVPMDGEKIKQVAINLVRNAIEALPEGGAVVVESGWADDRALMLVRDDGPGLPEGVDVFQLFVSTKARGTGLGLPIAQQIVNEHGGELSASTTPGKGAAFTVTLPLNHESKARPRPASDP